MIPILKIKDPNTGNWISILAIKGDPGADAYEKAVEQGYTGTPIQFYASLAEVSTKANLTGGNILNLLI